MGLDKPYRYDEDITGLNPDNLVAGEEIELSSREVRVARFRYGPVFLESVVLFDQSNQRRLEVDVDYRIPWISHELSLKCSKEIVHSVLIINQDVSDTLVASYQTLGGPSMPLSHDIMLAYEILINDNRSVDWTEGVFGKPNEYPPSAHPTFFNDIYGWQALAFQLERLTQAITLGNTPAFEQILNAYKTYAASKLQMETGEDLFKLVNLQGLLHVTDKYNFNCMKMIVEETVIQDGHGFWVDVEASNVKDNQIYYWKISHIDTDETDFVTRTGIVSMNKGTGRFFVQTAQNKHEEPDEDFHVSLHLQSVDGVEVMRSEKLTIRRHAERGVVRLQDVYQSDCHMHAPLANNPMAHALVPTMRAMRRLRY